MARRGWRAIAAACAAGLIWSGPAALAATRTAPPGTTTASGSLPGPRPGCPPQHGIAAPAKQPWAQQALRFSAVWDRTRGGGVTVAIVDSGVDANPQFGDRVISGPDLVAGTKPGIPPGADCVGHGTAVASIIAAAPVPGVSFTGVAPAARILSVKISGTDTFPTSVTPQGIMDAVQFGADVINLSLATPDDVPALRNAVEYALRHNVVVVAAAGNDVRNGGTDGSEGADGSGPFYPASYPGVLAVGAAAMMLATAVPWPTQSAPGGTPGLVPATRSGPGITRSPNCGFASTPLSTTATVTPLPRVRSQTAEKRRACCAHGSPAGAGIPGCGGQPGRGPGSPSVTRGAAWTAGAASMSAARQAARTGPPRRTNPPPPTAIYS